MTNALENKLVVSNPDFDTIKSNLKDFLRSQTTFSDYDFEGSALSNLIDLLAYNTHYMAFYANMIANEAFMDTASIRDSVVSHAKMLGYTPASIKSATANATLTFTQANNAGISTMTSLTLPRFTKFAASAIDGVNYSFTNLDEVTVTKSNSAFTFSNLTLTEGTPVNYLFTHNQLNNPLQEFELKDANIDTNTLEVIVQNSAVDLTQVTYAFATDATTVTNSSPVYYLNESKGRKYKIYFGDGILGKQLTDGNIVIVSYLLSKGADANKATKLTLLDSVGGLASGTVVTNAVASGGSVAESIDRVKFTAPKAYVSNNRAVTKNDYIALIQRDYPSLEAVNVWGGEENTPPNYGKVYISAKPVSGYEITTTEKQYILDTVVSPLSILTVTPEFVDADYNYLNLDVKVTYDPTATTKTPGEIATAVKSAIYSFADTNLNSFNSYFKLSRLMRDIDNIETSILSNQVDVKIEKRLEPVLNNSRNYTINFFTPLKRSTGTNRITSSPAYTAYDNDDNYRRFYFEEVPLSFTGISSIKVTLGGSGFTTAPTVRIIGDGIGATATAIITNGKITSVNIDSVGSEYTTAAAKVYDVDGNQITSVVLEAVIENTIGKIRTYYVDDNQIKVIYSEEAGTINYNTGVITLANLLPIDIENDLKVLKFYATPEEPLFSSSKNSIITIDIEDSAALSITPVQVK